MQSIKAADALEFVKRSPEEERLNALTHGLAFLLSVLAVGATIAESPPWPTSLAVSFGAYALSLTAVFAVSTVSHLGWRPDRKLALMALDQGVIYFLIAGTYTPLTWKFVPPGIREPALAVVWIYAAVGCYFKVVARRQVTDFSTHAYLWLGWTPAAILFPYVSWACLGWIFLGGLVYTIGTLFLMRDKEYWHFHAIWNLFVVTAGVCHFWAIYRFVLPHN